MAIALSPFLSSLHSTAQADNKEGASLGPGTAAAAGALKTGGWASGGHTVVRLPVHSLSKQSINLISNTNIYSYTGYAAALLRGGAHRPQPADIHSLATAPEVDHEESKHYVDVKVGAVAAVGSRYDWHVMLVLLMF